MSEFINTIDSLGDDTVINSIISGTITEFKDDRLTTVGKNALAYCPNLKTVVLPNVRTICEHAFNSSGVKTVDFYGVAHFGAFSLQHCSGLISIILRSEKQVSSGETQFFSTCSALIAKSCYIYVPKSLVDTYKADTNWSTYAELVRALEDYTVDGTITGELDESKI